jgi:hypothetical protein
MKKLEFTIQIKEPGVPVEVGPGTGQDQNNLPVALTLWFPKILFWLFCAYLCFAWSPFLILPVLLLDLVYNLTRHAWWI